MKFPSMFIAVLFAGVVSAQGLVEKLPSAEISPDARAALSERRTLTNTLNIRTEGGRSARKQMSFGRSAVILDNVRIEPGVRAGVRVKGVCKVSVLINDVPLRMSRTVIEGVRGTRRPAPRPEDDSPPRGIVTTLDIPSIYPTLLKPVSGPIALGPKDRLTIKLASPSKQTDCDAKVDVTTRAAESRKRD